MSQRKVRIGIDVGGTFTDAVVIDNMTLELIAKKKIPTTHDSIEGVAKGIINIIKELLEETGIAPEDIAFISHGTTQATNALLEGDVAKVGIIGMGDGNGAKAETNISNLELAPEKYLHVFHEFIPSKEINDSLINQAIDRLVEKGTQVIVASEAFSIEHPEHEERVISLAQKRGFYATGGYQISQLFGLKLRTRTAVVNGSLIPKMMETSEMTEKVIKELGIQKDLMIMRADGGVMSIDEVRKRPILTMLSGLAAGVAGAIMHEKISDGVFLEIGGTSTDISIIKDGQVMIKNASVGGHKTYLKSVDVQTTGIAGGTMIRHKNGELKIGPRSAHLAHLNYECFDFPQNSGAHIERITPREGDPDDYLVVKDDNGKAYAFTLAGAANYLGLIDDNDYSKATSSSYHRAWKVLGDYLGKDPKEVAIECMDRASTQIWNIIDDLIKDYELEKGFLTLFGGGGSAGVLTHYIGKKYGLRSKIVSNAPYISTIGVALAMISETLERSVINPTEEDIAKIRRNIIDKMLEMGALSETIEVSIEVDSMNHILRANATGTNEVKNHEHVEHVLADAELESIALKSVGLEHGTAKIIVKNKYVVGIQVEAVTKKAFGLIKRKDRVAVIIAHDGIVKVRRVNGDILYGNAEDIQVLMDTIMNRFSNYSDAGQTVPEVLAFVKYRFLNYAGLMNKDQILEILSMDFEGVEADERVLFVVTKRG